MEKIICSAIYFKALDTPVHRPVNVSQGMVLCGHRHPHVISQITTLTGKRMADLQPYIQGFLTDKNRFVGRDEALLIACDAKQMIRCTNSNELFSEDIY